MSITTIAGPTVRGDNTDTSAYTSNAWTPTANALQVIAAINGNATTASVGTLSGMGLSWTEIGTRGGALYATNSRRLQAWWAVAGASPSNDTVAVDYGSGATQTMCVIGGFQLAGANTVSPIVQSATTIASATTASAITVLLSALQVGGNNAVVHFHGGVSNGVTFTPGTGFTEQFEGGASDAVRLEGTYELNSTHTMTFSNPSGAVGQGALAMEIAAAAVSATRIWRAIDEQFGLIGPGGLVG